MRTSQARGKMSSTDPPEWEAYACGIPKKADDFSDGSCLELTEVHHVVHVPEARRILEDGWVKAGLVHDESRLKSSRMCVTWLSANTWVNGSIYGNVQFTFDWRRIVENRRVYWVRGDEELSSASLSSSAHGSRSHRVQPHQGIRSQDRQRSFETTGRHVVLEWRTYIGIHDR